MVYETPTIEIIEIPGDIITNSEPTIDDSDWDDIWGS